MNSEWTFIITLLTAVIVFIFLFNKLLSRIQDNSLKRMGKKIPELSDKKLLRQYKNLDSQRKNKFLALYISGIFYKSSLDMYEQSFQLHRAEVERRGLNP